MQRMGRRPEWAAMTDEQILAFYRARYPYIALGTAQRVAPLQVEVLRLTGSCVDVSPTTGARLRALSGRLCVLGQKDSPRCRKTSRSGSTPQRSVALWGRAPRSRA